jgi:Flp pilus assembly protein TadG
MRVARPRDRAERGAVVVEFSFVATLLVTLVLGLFEIGGIWSNHQSVTNASRTGARVGSQLGVGGEADSEALLAIQAALGPLAADLGRIVIYEADINGAMPLPCVSATAGYSGGSNCNVYDATSLANMTTPGWWGSGTSCGTADNNWCSATERDSAQASATYLGVHVEIEHRSLTSFFGGGTLTMSDTTVMRIEPEG